MDIDLNTKNEGYFEGDRFNTFNGNSIKAGPRDLDNVPDPDSRKNLHYNLNQIITKAQGNLISSTGIMAFHCIGDTGNDHSHNHNGGPTMRLAVANMMETQLESGLGQANTPSFCYHVGDLIYPGSDKLLYESEFYKPYSGYGNAIVAIPGNHDSFAPDGLEAYALNFMQPTLNVVKGERPAMNLPWYYWVLDTPVATIIGLATISDSISTQQQNWFYNEVNNADANKALIVTVHYPPYCFDGADNRNTRACINGASRMPDLVISGHSHNYQHIETPQGYTMIVNGAGGVSSGGINRNANGHGAKLIYGNDDDFGALTVIVDSKKRKLICNYYGAISTSEKIDTQLLENFEIDY